MARRRQVVWAALVVALVMAVGSAVAEGGFRRYWRLKRDVETLEARNARLLQDNARLRREVNALRDDVRVLERVAREELGYTRPGELVFDLEER
jgi:cell division protein FtsB